MRNVIDITGQRFGRIVVLERAGHSKAGNALFRCRCDCGKELVRRGVDLRRGRQSCGCLSHEQSSARLRKLHSFGFLVKHGMADTPEYKAYRAARDRCTNPESSSWKDYGGRGIEFRFTSLEQFMAEIGPRPTPEHSLDRINNDGHYEPGNVRWATASEQRRNQRPRKAITPPLLLAIKEAGNVAHD